MPLEVLWCSQFKWYLVFRTLNKISGRFIVFCTWHIWKFSFFSTLSGKHNLNKRSKTWTYHYEWSQRIRKNLYCSPLAVGSAFVAMIPAGITATKIATHSKRVKIILANPCHLNSFSWVSLRIYAHCIWSGLAEGLGAVFGCSVECANGDNTVIFTFTVCGCIVCGTG